MHRRQNSIAIRADGFPWLLLNASPDLPRQIEVYLAETTGKLRSSPVGGALLTNADLDHVLGLLLLREGSTLDVVAPTGVRDTLVQTLRFGAILEAFAGVRWLDAGREWNAAPGGEIEFRAIPIAGATPPRFAPSSAGDHGVGYLVRQAGCDRVAGFFPDLATLDNALLAELRSCHILFVDGTFWSEDELVRLGIGSRPAVEMGHLPVAASLPRLAPLAAAGTQVYYLHINNTNPILDPGSPERREVELAGLRVAEDGQRHVLR